MRRCPVVDAPARIADVPVYLNGVGTAKARNTVTVRPQVDGRILSIKFREGQEVKRGDVLALIDPATYQAQLDQAMAKKALDEVQLANAQRDLERYAKLAATSVGAEDHRHAARAWSSSSPPRSSSTMRRSPTPRPSSTTPPSWRRSTAAPASAWSTKAISCALPTPASS